MNKKTLNYPIVIHDILLICVVGFSTLFFSFYTILPHFDIINNNIKIVLFSLTFLIYLASLISYLYIEYRHNNLKFKNIFFYIAAAIILINFIAVACLPNNINLPNGGLMGILPFERVYYLLSGFTLATLPLSFFYLIPRRINNRHYVNIILIGIMIITAISILISLIMDYKAYVTIFTSHFKDIQKVELKSFFGSKNVFARVLLTGIIASTLLHFRTKNKKWLLALIPFIFIFIFTSAYMSLLLGFLYLLIYLIIHVVLIAKKNKDNLIITSLLGGFILLFVVYLGTMTAISTDGFLFNIKSFIINAVNHVKTTFESRQVIWSSAFSLLAPCQYVFGFGVTAFGVALHNTYTPIAPEWDQGIYHAHNGGIELIGRGGVLLLLIYLFLYVYLIYLSIKIYRKKPLLASIGLLIIIGQLVHNVVEPQFVCNGFDMTTTLLTTLPIISEYNILYKKDFEVKESILESAEKINDIESKSKIFNLNKKCILLEAKYINKDSN